MTVTEPRLDHVVYATPDIDRLVAEFTERTGVEPPLGGRHVGRGTRNYLVGLGGAAYLELIGPDDPAQAGQTPTFGIDTLTGPTLVTWVIRPDDIEATVAGARAAGYDPGEIGPLSRRTPDGVLLEWRLTQNPPHDKRNGLVPTLIDWLEAPHPTTSGLPVLPLTSLVGFHPEPDVVRRDLAAVGAELELREGAPGFELTLDTPSGPVTLR